MSDSQDQQNFESIMELINTLEEGAQEVLRKAILECWNKVETFRLQGLELAALNKELSDQNDILKVCRSMILKFWDVHVHVFCLVFFVLGEKTPFVNEWYVGAWGICSVVFDLVI